MTQKDKIKLANAVIKGQALSLIEELKEIISNIITE